MPTGIPTNRTALTLPTDLSQEILRKTTESSAIMRLARRVNLPGRGLTIPVITADAEANWVAETNQKPVSNPGISSKLMTPYTIAVIVPFSKQFLRDLRSLYDELVRRLPDALGLCFDKTVIGAKEKPGTNFDNFAECTAQSMLATSDSDLYDALVAAKTDIAAHGGILNGWALSPQGEGLLLGARDVYQGRPLFIASAQDGDPSRVLGAPTVSAKGLYKAGTAGTDGTPAIVGVAGDWTQALYGTVEGVEVSVSDQASVTIGSGTSAELVSLWERNMVAVRAEIEVGFRADTSVFNLLTGAVPTA